MTRYGLISDVHGDFDRLAYAVQILDQQNVDKVYHLGDLVFGLSRKSEEVIQLLSGLGVEGIWGWHDKEEIEYDGEKLSEESRNYLKSLPQKILLDDETILVHDNPLSLNRVGFRQFYVNSSEDAHLVFEKCSFKRMIIGHNHMAAVFCTDHSEQKFKESGFAILDSEKRYVLCPGSVGMPRDSSKKYSSCAVYDDKSQRFEIIRFFGEFAIPNIDAEGLSTPN